MAQALMCFASYDEASAQRHSREKLPRNSQVGALAWRARHCLSVYASLEAWPILVRQSGSLDLVAAATGTVMPRKASLQAEGSKPNHLCVFRLGCVCLFGSYGVNITYFGTHGACQAQFILARYLV